MKILLPAAVLAGLLIATLAEPAHPQWKIPEWSVQCPDPSDGHLIECTASRDGLDLAAVAEFHERELEAASDWLAGLEFPAPFYTYEEAGQWVVPITSRPADRDPETMADYVVHEAITGFQGEMSLYRDGMSDPYALREGLQNGDYGDDASGYLSRHIASDLFREIASAVHELFHAVQAGIMGAPAFYATGKPQDWIVEGTAEAAHIAWLVEGGTARYPITPSPKYRPYDRPLHLPEAPDLAHGTSGFWLAVGEEIGSPARIRWFEEVFRHLRRRAEDDPAGIRAVHAALGVHHEEGLYHFYPWFIARVAKHVDEYEDLQEISARFGTVSRLDRVKGLSARAHRVRVDVDGGDGLMGLSVELSEGDREDPSLHLVVDDERYDRAVERNVFRTSVDGSADYLVRVVNVAPEPSSTSVRAYTLLVTLEPAEPCDGDVMASVVRERTWRTSAAVGRRLWPAMPARTGRGPLLRPAEYERLYEPMPGLHPSEGTLRFGGLVDDGGVACADPIGTNVGVEAVRTMDEEELRERAQEAAAEAVARMSAMESEAELEAAMDSTSSMLGQVFGLDEETGSKMGLGVRVFEDVVSGATPGSTLLKLYAPNAISWQFDGLHGARGISHSGLGGWARNSEAQVFLELPGTPPSALAEREEPYPARLHTIFEGHPVYTRWQGREERIPGARAEGDLPPPVAFEGELVTLEAEALAGELVVEELTGAEVCGTLALEGTGRLEVVEHEIVRDEEGRALRDRIADRSERRGPISLAGEFCAPAAVEYTRGMRVISRTAKVE